MINKELSDMSDVDKNEVKFCVNCKYHLPRKKWFGLAKADPIKALCTHLEAEHYGVSQKLTYLVTGIRNYNAFKAYEMRKLYMVCGETAKLFEPKTVDDVPNEPAKK